MKNLKKKRLCWQSRFWFIDYGYDDEFGTGIIKNDCSVAIAMRGYWVGVERWRKKR